jgi:hypothetical protein
VCYFPRDLFFCFFTFKLTIGAFTPVPSDTGLGTGCFFDFPAMPNPSSIEREATDDPTLQAVRHSRTALSSCRMGIVNPLPAEEVLVRLQGRESTVSDGQASSDSVV